MLVVFMGILIWLLTSFLFVLTLDLLFIRAREPKDLPFGACWGLLFTIPFLRNSLPSIPPIGIAYDVWVFLPSLMITSVSALLAMSAHLGYSSATYTDRFQRPTKPKDLKDEDETEPDRQNTMDVIASAPAK